MTYIDAYKIQTSALTKLLHPWVKEDATATVAAEFVQDLFRSKCVILQCPLAAV